MASENSNESTFNPRRRLCPDGSCIGIIGLDGKCTVCGSSVAGAAGAAGAIVPSSPVGEGEREADLDTDPVSDDPGTDEASTDAADGDLGTGKFDPNRRLCSDDTCVGVIDASNRCPVCGKPATE